MIKWGPETQDSLSLEEVQSNPKLLFMLPINKCTIADTWLNKDAEETIIQYLTKENNWFWSWINTLWVVDIEVMFEWFKHPVRTKIDLVYFRDLQYFNTSMAQKNIHDLRLCKIDYLQSDFSRPRIILPDSQELVLQSYYWWDKEDLLSWRQRDSEYLKWIMELEHQIDKSIHKNREFSEQIAERYLSIVKFKCFWISKERYQYIINKIVEEIWISNEAEKKFKIKQLKKYFNEYQPVSFQKIDAELIEWLDQWKIQLKHAYLDQWANDFDQILRASWYTEYFEAEMSLIENNAKEFSKNLWNVHLSYWGWIVAKESALYSQKLLWNRDVWSNYHEGTRKSLSSKLFVQDFHDSHIFINIESSEAYLDWLTELWILWKNHIFESEDGLFTYRNAFMAEEVKWSNWEINFVCSSKYDSEMIKLHRIKFSKKIFDVFSQSEENNEDQDPGYIWTQKSLNSRIHYHNNNISLKIKDFWWSISLSILWNTLYNMEREEIKDFFSSNFEKFGNDLVIMAWIYKQDQENWGKYWKEKGLNWKMNHLFRTYDLDHNQGDYEFNSTLKKDWTSISKIVLKKDKEIKIWSCYTKVFTEWTEFETWKSYKKDISYIQNIISEIPWLYIDSTLDDRLVNFLMIKHQNWEIYWESFNYSQSSRFKNTKKFIQEMFEPHNNEYVAGHNYKKWSLTVSLFTKGYNQLMTVSYNREIETLSIQEKIEYMKSNNPLRVYISWYNTNIRNKTFSDRTLLFNYNYNSENWEEKSELEYKIQKSQVIYSIEPIDIWKVKDLVSTYLDDENSQRHIIRLLEK